jgi:HEPN domain-containing protein
MHEEYKLTRTLLVNDFAFRSFLKSGDQDYVAARLSYKAKLSYPFLWQSQQAIEKYLKCILLLNRIHAKRVGHDLDAALAAIHNSGQVELGLTPSTKNLIDELNQFGQYRYLEVSYVASSWGIVQLDRAVWELRRFCTFNLDFRKLKLVKGQVAPKYRLETELLEKIYDDKHHPARPGLVWNNAFIGGRSRKIVRMRGWMDMVNAPLDMHPEIMDELLKYVHLPSSLVKQWRNHKGDFEVTDE